MKNPVKVHVDPYSDEPILTGLKGFHARQSFIDFVSLLPSRIWSKAANGRDCVVLNDEDFAMIIAWSQVYGITLKHNPYTLGHRVFAPNIFIDMEVGVYYAPYTPDKA